VSLIKVTKEFIFDAAHRIPDHQGKCKNVHGHTYRVQVTVAIPLCEFKREEGMVMDFGDLSQVVSPAIMAMDHALILRRDDPFCELLDKFDESEQKLMRMDGPPTAENMAVDIGISMESFLSVGGRPGPQVMLDSVRVWETPTSFAEYEGQGVSPCLKCSFR
jgi:6-pyruvoyltetrahydropterin/6-carboxytetrahydropterin synthase